MCVSINEVKVSEFVCVNCVFFCSLGFVVVVVVVSGSFNMQ